MATHCHLHCGDVHCQYGRLYWRFCRQTDISLPIRIINLFDCLLLYFTWMERNHKNTKSLQPLCSLPKDMSKTYNLVLSMSAVVQTVQTTLHFGVANHLTFRIPHKRYLF
jgi:hypothetical protein